LAKRGVRDMMMGWIRGVAQCGKKICNGGAWWSDSTRS